MRQRLLVAGLVFVCLAASALALYTFRLDAELRARFDGVRYGYRCENPVDLHDLYSRTRQEGFG